MNYRWFRLSVESVYETLQVTRVRKRIDVQVFSPEPKAQSVLDPDVTLA